MVESVLKTPDHVLESITDLRKDIHDFGLRADKGTILFLYERWRIIINSLA